MSIGMLSLADLSSAAKQSAEDLRTLVATSKNLLAATAVAAQRGEKSIPLDVIAEYLALQRQVCERALHVTELLASALFGRVNAPQSEVRRVVSAFAAAIDSGEGNDFIKDASANILAGILNVEPEEVAASAMGSSTPIAGEDEGEALVSLPLILISEMIFRLADKGSPATHACLAWVGTYDEKGDCNLCGAETLFGAKPHNADCPIYQMMEQGKE